MRALSNRIALVAKRAKLSSNLASQRCFTLLLDLCLKNNINM
jgi:hypothetical protein